MADELQSGPVWRVGPHLSLRFLGFEREEDGREAFVVEAHRGDVVLAGQLRFTGGTDWTLSGEPLALGPPDEVFARAVGGKRERAEVLAALPHLPRERLDALVDLRSSGAGTLAFDGRWFLDRLAVETFERPLVLVDAVNQLGLDGMARAGQILADASESSSELVELLEAGLTSPRWDGEGRLIGASHWGDLVQVGNDVAEGCEAARGRGDLSVTFPADQPMGLSFAPEVPSADVAAGWEPAAGESAGWGAEVGPVEPGAFADQAGVREGMVVRRLSSLATSSLATGTGERSFEAVLEAIDRGREGEGTVTIAFDTAAPLRRWYAVEMPAADVLSAFRPSGADLDVAAEVVARCNGLFLWREPIPRVFIGAPGSVTCAHVDICPQVQLAHGLLGTKLLGVASHAATARLRRDHAADDESEARATTVPTHGPPTDVQASLLNDPEVTLVLLRPGDLAVFHSGALHFASNGAEGLSAALYHGVITRPVLPRLREAAAAPGGSAPEGAYAGHLFASDLLALVEARGLPVDTPGER